MCISTPRTPPEKEPRGLLGKPLAGNQPCRLAESTRRGPRKGMWMPTRAVKPSHSLGTPEALGGRGSLLKIPKGSID